MTPHVSLTPEMIAAGARALVPHVAGVLPDDRWTLTAAEDVLRAAIEVIPAENPKAA